MGFFDELGNRVITKTTRTLTNEDRHLIWKEKMKNINSKNQSSFGESNVRHRR